MTKKIRRLDRVLASRGATEVSLSGGVKAERYAAEDIERIAEIRSLKEVSIDRQAITKFPAALAKLPHLDVLELTTCPITSLAGIEKLVHLRALRLGELNLDFARELRRLAALPKLATLELYGREVKIPPAAVIRSVTELRLVDTGLNLATAFGALAKYPTLRRLTVENIRSSLTVPDEVAKLQQIRHLTLGGYGSMKLSPKIGKLTKLESLSISPLRVIPEELCDCAGLVELRIGGAPKAIPAAIARLSKLRTLALPWRGHYTVPDSLYAMKLRAFEGRPDIAKKIGRLRS